VPNFFPIKFYGQSEANNPLCGSIIIYKKPILGREVMNVSKKLTFLLCLLAAGILCAGGAWAATLNVNDPVLMASDPDAVIVGTQYVRGQAVTYDGTNYWLFFSVSGSLTGTYATGNPDTHDYSIWYKKASTIAGLASATATKVPLPNNSNIFLGELDATYWPGDNTVRVSAMYDNSGTYTNTADCNFFVFMCNAGTMAWSQYNMSTDAIYSFGLLGDGAAHHAMITEVGTASFWVAANNGVNWIAKRWQGGVVTTYPLPAAGTNGTGKFVYDGTTLYFVVAQSSVLSLCQWTGAAWISLYTIPTVAPWQVYDATAAIIGGVPSIICAPYQNYGGPWGEHQMLVTLSGGPTLTTIDTSAYRKDTDALNTNVWCGFWPTVAYEAGQPYLFYTSERNEADPTTEVEGQIYCVPLNWPVTENNFMFLENGIFQAASGDTINVGPGTFYETGQMHVTQNLSIVGAGKTSTFIKPTLDTGSSSDSRGWFMADAGVTFDMSDVTLDGTGRLIYQGIRHKGNGTIKNIDFTNIKYNESGPDYKGTAITTFAGQNIAVTDCTFSQIGRVGILCFGAGVTGTFSNITYTGKGAGDWLDYGIEFGGGGSGTVSGISTITNCLGVASADGSTSAGIMASTYYGAGTAATITNCILTNNSCAIAVGIDASDTSTVVAHYNNLSGGIDGVWSTAPQVDARYNWWGAPDGPIGPAGSIGPTGGGSGVGVSAYVIYNPWLDSVSQIPYLTQGQMVVDYGAAGIMAYDGSGNWLDDVNDDNPDNMVLLGNKLYVDAGSIYPQIGLYVGVYNSTKQMYDWTQQTSVDPDNLMVSGSMLYADLGGVDILYLPGPLDKGFWSYDGINPPTRLTGADSKRMATSPSTNYAFTDFSDACYSYDPVNGFKGISTNHPSFMMADDTFLYIWLVSGLYKWDIATKAFPANPGLNASTVGQMVLTEDGTGFYAKMTSQGGIYKCVSATKTWTLLTSNNPQKMIVVNGTLYASYGTGLWKYNSGTSWTKIANMLPTALGEYNNKLVFAYANKLYEYNGISFSQIHSGYAAQQILDIIVP
jgi:hypothetical protein